MAGQALLVPFGATAKRNPPSRAEPMRTQNAEMSSGTKARRSRSALSLTLSRKRERELEHRVGLRLGCSCLEDIQSQTAPLHLQQARESLQRTGEAPCV